MTKPPTIAPNDLDARVREPAAELACPVERHVASIVRPDRMPVVDARGRKRESRDEELDHYEPRSSGRTSVPSGFMR